ncbi:MAG: glycoside hydrolase family 31 protein [Bacteroidales bacterium]|nr:glycoside hydrolase family 31 protein [Bacteroidales bacterium]
MKKFERKTIASSILLFIVMACLAADQDTGQTLGDHNLSTYCSKVLVGHDMEVSLYTSRMFRIRTSNLEGEKFPPKYEIPFIIGKLEKWDPVEYSHWEDGQYDYIETEVIRILISKANLDWTVWSKGGERQIYPSEGRITGLFRDGYTVFDNASAFNEHNNNNRYTHWFYNPSTGRYVDTYLHEDLIFEQYFIYGPDYPALFSQLNELIGPEPLLPLKAYGTFHMQHLICEGSQEQLLAYARKLRDKDLPCDALIIADEWGDGCPGGGGDDYWGQLDWYENYTKPLSVKGMCDSLDAMHFDVMTIHHSAPDFVHRAENTPRRIREWTSRVYDENLWWEKMEEQYDQGVDGTWQDTRQNDITDGVIWAYTQEYIGPENRVLFNGCRKMMLFNFWDIDGRDNTIAANNLIGSRRYPFRWTGDIENSYAELKYQINAITNTHGSMKGVSYITCDDFGKDWKVHARFNQFLDFLPVSRTHAYRPWQFILSDEEWEHLFKEEGYESAEDYILFPDDASHNPMRPLSEVKREIMEKLTNKVTYDIKTAENSIRKHRKLRYMLLPYIYSTAYVNYLTGIPICRPMLLAFPEDSRCRQDHFPYQYMFGEYILVAPVYGDFNTMEIYLPSGNNWIDYWDKRMYEGGQLLTYKTSDVEKLPLFIRSGSIIPMRKEQNWIEKGEIWDPLIFDIYPDEVSTFTLFEDDGRTIYYQDGQFAETIFECSLKSSEISIIINKSEGDYNGKPDDRTFLFHLNMIESQPETIICNAEVLKEVPDLKKLDNELCGWTYNRDQGIVTIKLFGKASEKSEIIVSLESTWN